MLTTWDNTLGLKTYTLVVTVLSLPTFEFSASAAGDGACQAKLDDIKSKGDGTELTVGKPLTAPGIFTDVGGCGHENFGSITPTFKLKVVGAEDDGERIRLRSRREQDADAPGSEGYLVNPVTGAFSITRNTTGNVTVLLVASDDNGQDTTVLSLHVIWVAVPSASAGEGEGVDTITFVMSAIAGLLLVLVLAGGLRHLKQRAELLAARDFSDLVQGLNLDGTVSDSQGGRVIPAELKRSGVRLINEIGSGEFGLVWKGMYLAPRTSISHELHVAIKELRNDPSAHEREELMREAAVTAQFDHPNVIGLIGVVTAGEPALLVLQFCDKGSLSSMLQESPEPFAVGTLVGFCLDAVKGMAYLAERRFLHRDLAARNVLVNAYDVAMVADFGLSRDVLESEYYKSVDSNAKLPLRWTSIEAIKHQRFSEQSDVWAFGVTCFEIFTEGQLPYREWMNWYVMEMVTLKEYKLPCPPRCPADFYKNALRPCLETLPGDRPTFAELVIRVTAVMAVAEATEGMKKNVAYEQTTIGDGYDHPEYIAVNEQAGYVVKHAASQQDTFGFSRSSSLAVVRTSDESAYVEPVPVSDILINPVAHESNGCHGYEYCDDATMQAQKRQSLRGTGQVGYVSLGVAGNRPDGGAGPYSQLHGGSVVGAQHQYVPVGAASKGGAALYAPVDGQSPQLVSAGQQQYMLVGACHAASKGGAALYVPVDDTPPHSTAEFLAKTPTPAHITVVVAGEEQETFGFPL